MQLPTHDHVRILLALFSHVTSFLSLRKLTTNNQAIYRWLDRLQWDHIYIPPYLRQRVGNPPSIYEFFFFDNKYIYEFIPICLTNLTCWRLHYGADHVQRSARLVHRNLQSTNVKCHKYLSFDFRGYDLNFVVWISRGLTVCPAPRIQ
jgi:hypothetical protein